MKLKTSKKAFQKNYDLNKQNLKKQKLKFGKPEINQNYFVYNGLHTLKNNFS